MHLLYMNTLYTYTVYMDMMYMYIVYGWYALVYRYTGIPFHNVERIIVTLLSCNG